MSGIMCMMAGGGGLGGIVGTPNLNAIQTASGVANAVLSLLNTGNYTATGEAGGAYATPGAIAASLEARLTFVSGDNLVTGSAVGSWLALSTTRTWTMTAAGTAFYFGTYTLEIREIASGLMRDTSTITFEAESF